MHATHRLIRSGFPFIALLAAFLLPRAHAAGRSVGPGDYILDKGYGSLSIKRGKDSGLRFEIAAIGANGHTCGLDGELKNGQAKLDIGEGEKSCTVHFNSSAIGIDVTSSDCSYFCGVRAGFDGTYVKPAAGCDVASRSKTQQEFKRLYDAKAYGQARAKLDTLIAKCEKVIHWSELGSIRNDLAITLYKLHDPSACLARLAPYIEDAAKDDDEIRGSYPPVDFDIYSGIIKAARTNIRLCKKQMGQARNNG